MSPSGQPCLGASREVRFSNKAKLWLRALSQMRRHCILSCDVQVCAQRSGFKTTQLASVVVCSFNVWCVCVCFVVLLVCFFSWLICLFVFWFGLFVIVFVSCVETVQYTNKYHEFIAIKQRCVFKCSCHANVCFRSALIWGLAPSLAELRVERSSSQSKLCCGW